MSELWQMNYYLSNAPTDNSHRVHTFKQSAHVTVTEENQQEKVHNLNWETISSFNIITAESWELRQKYYINHLWAVRDRGLCVFVISSSCPSGDIVSPSLLSSSLSQTKKQSVCSACSWRSEDGASGSRCHPETGDKTEEVLQTEAGTLCASVDYHHQHKACFLCVVVEAEICTRTSRKLSDWREASWSTDAFNPHKHKTCK